MKMMPKNDELYQVSRPAGSVVRTETKYSFPAVKKKLGFMEKDGRKTLVLGPVIGYI